MTWHPRFWLCKRHKHSHYYLGLTDFFVYSSYSLPHPRVFHFTLKSSLFSSKKNLFFFSFISMSLHLS
jgi:hypothetical protein